MKAAGNGGHAVNRRELIWEGVIFALVVIYLGMFAWLNLTKYSQHVDSDIASEALLAREIWTEKELTPDDWIASTERYVFGMPMVASVFYGITGSMATAAGIACVLIGAALVGVLYWFLRRIGLSRLAGLAAILVLCAVPVNGLRNEGQMVPFVMLLLFVFADYYALHSILMFLTIAFYFHLKKGRPGRREAVCWFLLFGFTTALALGGQRCLQMVILPMAAVEAVSLFRDSDGFSHRLAGSRYYAAGYVGTMLLAALISSAYKGQADYPMFLLNAREAMERVFVTVPGAVLEGFGLAGGVYVGSFESLMQMLVWAFLALVGFGLVFISQKKNAEVAAEQRGAIAILAASLGITAFIIAFTTAEPAHNYFLFSWYVAIVTVGVLIDCFRKKRSWFADVILLAVCVFAALNIKYTYADALTTTDNLKEYEEVADFLIEEGIDYGYAEFWDAGRISLVRDGAVTMGHSYVMEDLRMYWWLTSVKWYPPDLPEAMRTAYVVKLHKKEAFEAQFSEGEAVELRFENERFAVYISEKNYMKMQ